MSSATRIGFWDGSTIPSWPTRMRLVCMPTNRSSSTGLLESSKPSTWKWCSVKLIES